MNLSETARLLGAMAAFDRRTVGDADVIAWQAVMDDIPFADALTAVKHHYSEGEAWLMPVHIRQSVKAMQEERRDAARATGWAPGQAGVPKDQAMPEVAGSGPLALSDLPAAVAELVARLRADLPDGSREALHPRRAAWEREHKAYLRTHNPEPNPHYKPKAGEDLTPVSFSGPTGATAEVCRNASHEHFPGDPVLRSCVFEASRRLTVDEAVVEVDGTLDA